MAERRDAVVRLDQQARVDRLLDTRITGEIRDEREIDRLARDRGHLERPHARRAEPVGAEQHGLANAVRKRHVVTGRELDRVGVLLEASACGERRRKLLDQERHTLGALEDPLHETRPGRSLDDPRDQRRDLIALERREHQLLQPPTAPELGPHATERMRARHVVAAIRREEEQRLALHGRRQRRQQIEGRLVDPLEIVEEHGSWLTARDPGERLDHRLGQE